VDLVDVEVGSLTAVLAIEEQEEGEGDEAEVGTTDFAFWRGVVSTFSGRAARELR
jgi:hypothetical protein